MGLPRRQRIFTPQEYLRVEREADYKSEYVDGEIFAMAGGSPDHNTICANLIGMLWTRLKGTPCRVFTSDSRVAAGNMYTYPDAAVVCGEPAYQDAASDNLTNPRAIFEVLSPSTEHYDRGEKFEKYRQIPALTDYFLISQTEPRIEHYTRATDSWMRRDYAGWDAAATLDAAGCVLPLNEIYDRVSFPATVTH